MAQTTVRIHNGMHATLRSLARAERRPMNAILEDAIESYRRRRFLEGLNEGYAALRRDDKAWSLFREEVGEIEGTLLDGLEESPAPPRSMARRRRNRRK